MKKFLAIAGVAALAAAAFVYWFGFRNHGKAAAKPVAAAEDPWTKPRPESRAKPRDGAPPPNGLPTLARDTDPDGPLLLEGQVLDEHDQPVAGAVVRISTAPARTAKTDADGSFSFDKLLGRAYSLTARAGDEIGGPVTTKVSAKAEPVVIRLRHGAVLTVSVSDADDHKPIAGATVIVEDRPDESQTTGADGTTVFHGIDDRWVRVVASAPGYGPSIMGKMIGQGAREETIALALHRGAAVSGRVIDEGGAGITGARVWAVDAGNTWMSASEDTAVISGKDGAYTIPALAGGSYVLRAKDESHAPASSSTITIAGTTPTTGIDIVMKAGATLAGTVVTTDGKPVPYASVRLSSKSRSMDMVYRQAAADDRGEFMIRALPRSELKVRAESEEAASKAIDVDLTRTPDARGVKLVLDLTSTISGIVVDGDGQPVAEAQVSAYPDFLDDKKTADDFVLAQQEAATTDGGGHFVLRGLEDGGYRLWAQRSSGGRTSRSGRPEGVAAKAGASDVRLVLPAPGGIKGKVAFEDGDVPVLAVVSADWEHRFTVHDKDGGFELDDLGPGSYDLRVTGAEFAQRIKRDVVVVDGKTTDAGTIVVRPGRKITGKVIDSKGSPIEGAKVVFGKMLFGDGKQVGGDDPDAAQQWGLRMAVSDADGAFVLNGLSQGGGSLVAEQAERGRSVAQKIPPGKDDVVGVTIALRGFGSIAGKVTRKGEAVAGAMVTVSPIGASGQALFVNGGQDGTYVIDRVPEGDNALSAMETGMMSMSGGARTVTVVAGKRTEANLVLPAGDDALTVTLTPKPGETVNAAQVFLFRGAMSVSNGEQLMDAFFANQGVKAAEGATEMAVGGAAGMLFWLGGASYPTFKELMPGAYTVCVIPITGNFMDQQLMGRILRNLDKLEVICKSAPVTATPTEQNITFIVPAMKPLPDDDGAS